MARHKNPVFNRCIGLSPCRSLCVDTLHAIFLGVMKAWCKTALWALLLSGLFGAHATNEEHVEIALNVLRHALRTFYITPAGAGLTRLHDLTSKMVGTTMRSTETTNARLRPITSPT